MHKVSIRSKLTPDQFLPFLISYPFSAYYLFHLSSFSMLVKNFMAGRLLYLSFH